MLRLIVSENDDANKTESLKVVHYFDEWIIDRTSRRTFVLRLYQKFTDAICKFKTCEIVVRRGTLILHLRFLLYPLSHSRNSRVHSGKPGICAFAQGPRHDANLDFVIH